MKRNTIFIILVTLLMILTLPNTVSAKEVKCYKKDGKTICKNFYYTYRHFKISKTSYSGKVTPQSLQRTKQAIEEHINSLQPDSPRGVKGFVSEGPNSRDFHIWVLRGNNQAKWTLGWAKFNRNSANIVKEWLTPETIILGVDGAKIQSLYYLTSRKYK